ncbi:MAG TPA: hypothetical protein VIN61_09780 [Gammaproteobacteria bacterium]
MRDDSEIIAVLLADGGEERWRAGEFGKDAQCLVRLPDGRVHLEPLTSREEFEVVARKTGCFRRGKPIRDPQTHEIMGYEMEEVPVLRAAAGM